MVRAVLGFVLYAHATQKAVGWFHGPGMAKAAAIFEGLGQHPGRRMAATAVLCELVAAVLLAVGLATPLGAAVGAGTMLVAAVATNLKAGARWNTAGGGEYPLVLAVVVVALGFTGPGRWSVDAVLGVPSAAGDVRIGLAVVVVAALAASVPILRTTRAVRA
ncbi:DoxX family protein [Amycolatopsis mongoliensis]|uniref:DoxX family protein n=1 Tax=Amycolatopsis mongoliensis TaxID=715475 RepID=A0A9Y2K2C1_9PSEU|nr:DoxX family protein [Amycolatopsis sp. 4-36]WIY07602.1 DoxX family protein [Amycolatopsis sp. 4-36]